MAAPAARLVALDGLRGVAALVVVLFHVTEIARPVAQGASPAAWWAITQTPAKLLTSGTEAVLVFFVLSGLVVALPALRDGFSWAGYTVTRLVRLYLPVWAALALVVLLVTVLPRDEAAVTPDSWMITTTVTAIDPARLASEASLTRGSYDIVSVLWTLRWEIVFSLALPLFVIGAMLVRTRWVAATVVCGVLTVVGRMTGEGALTFLPLFLLGTLMAVRLDDVRSRMTALTARARGTLLVASLALLVANWMARPLIPAGTPANQALYGLAGLGAAGVVLCVLGGSGAGALTSPPVHWLGRVSFSLYLVHVPVLTTLTFAFGDGLWWLAGLVGVPLSLGVAWAFHRVVETPSHRLARRLGSAVAPRTRSADRLVASLWRPAPQREPVRVTS